MPDAGIVWAVLELDEKVLVKREDGVELREYFRMENATSFPNSMLGRFMKAAFIRPNTPEIASCMVLSRCSVWEDFRWSYSPWTMDSAVSKSRCWISRARYWSARSTDCNSARTSVANRPPQLRLKPAPSNRMQFTDSLPSPLLSVQHRNERSRTKGGSPKRDIRRCCTGLYPPMGGSRANRKAAGAFSVGPNQMT